MALPAGAIDACAQACHQAEKTRQRIRPFSVVHPGFTVDDAYAVQRRWVEIKVAEGNAVKGHKIGLTSRAMQRSVGINEPDYGALMADMFYHTWDEIPMARFIQPRLECELGFVIGRRLKGPGVTLFDVQAAADYVVPCAEIVDGRTHRVDPDTGKARSVLDSIADNAGNAALIIGGRPIRPMDVDLRWVSVLCHRNNVIEESGVAAAVMNHPGNGIAWLANKLSPLRHGAGARAVRPQRLLHRRGRGARGRHLQRGLRPARHHHGTVRVRGPQA